MPLLDTPLVLQKQEHDCGSAVFKCITSYWEGKGRRHKSDVLYGTHPDALEPAFRSAGYRVLSGEMDTATLKSLTRNGWPVACLVKAEGVGHWVVVRGVERGRVYLMDPYDGLTSVRAADWERDWHDFDRRQTVFRQYGLAVWC